MTALTVQLDVRHQAEVVAGEGERGKSVSADVLLGGGVQHCHGLHDRTVEDVVQDVFLFARVSDFPCCPLECVEAVGGGERQFVAGGDGGVDWLAGGSIEVSSDDDWSVLRDGSQPGENVRPLLCPEGGEEGAPPRLEVSGDHTVLRVEAAVAEGGAEDHLVALHPPHLQHSPHPADQRELGPLEEDGAACVSVKCYKSREIFLSSPSGPVLPSM